MTSRQTATEIEEEAIRWVSYLDRTGRTASIEAELEEWLKGDSRRRGAWLQAEATWTLAGGFQGRSIAAIEEAGQPSRRHRRSRRDFGWRAAIAACVAAGVAVLFVLPHNGKIYDTEIGEIRRVALEDRSSVAINTSSRIDVNFRPSERRVNIEHGEVWFQVAKDHLRPFVVEVGPVRVQAVGTAFSVRRRSDGADVLVTEGVVKAWVSGAEGHVVLIRAGSRAFIADNSAITESVAPPSQIDRQLAWRGGRIDLGGETLTAAAAEFNRYSSHKIMIRSASVGDKRLHGVFRIDDPEGFARAAAMSLGARATVSDDGTINIDVGR